MRVFLDSSVIIFGLEKPHSNSGKILNALLAGGFQAVINEKVIIEVKRYISKRKGKQTAYLVESILRKHVKVINEMEFQERFESLKTEIKAKDVEHLATVRELNISIIVAFDRDFKNVKEYLTPKDFVLSMGMKPSETEF